MTTLTSSIPSFDHDELIQSHPVPTLLIDGGGVVLFVNSAAEQLCNVSRSAMVGRVVYDVIHMDRSYRQRMNDAATSALFDPVRFCRTLEAAYAAMIDHARAGRRPGDFTVTADLAIVASDAAVG